MPEVNANQVRAQAALPPPAEIDESGNLPTQAAPITGQLQPPAAPAAQPVTVSVPGTPAVTATSPNKATHSFIGRVLGALAGEPPTVYQADATGKVAPAPNQPADTAAAKVRRIFQHGLEGLAQPVPQQKSGAADLLAGLGSGFSTVQAQKTAEDQASKQQVRADFEQEQQNMLHKMELARGNAVTYTTLAHAHREEIDRNEIYNMGKAVVTNMEGENIPVERLTGDQLATRFHETPQQLLTEGKVLAIDEREMTGPDGTPIIDPNTNGPRWERPYAYVPGMHDGKFKLPQSFTDYLQKYAPYATDTKIAGGDLAAIKEGQEVDLQQFNRLHNAAAEGNKTVLQGWAKPEAVETADGKIWEKNTVSGEMRPASQERADAYTDRKQKREHAQKEEEKLNLEIGKLKREGSEETADIGAQGQDLVEGDMDPTQIQKRGKTYNAVVQAARVYSLKKYGKPFDLAQATADYKFATDPKTQNRLKYINSLTGDPRTGEPGNLDLLIQYSNKVNRTEFPPLNDVAAWVKLETGNQDIVKLRNAAVDAADQFANIMSGGGSGSATSDAKIRQGMDMFSAKFSKGQMDASAQSVKDMLANRKRELIGDNCYLRKQYGSSQTVQQQTSPTGAVHQGKAADGTPVWKMQDGSIQDASGNKYDPSTGKRVQ